MALDLTPVSQFFYAYFPLAERGQNMVNCVVDMVRRLATDGYQIFDRFSNLLRTDLTA